MAQTIQDRLDKLSQRRINDLLSHAQSYYDSGDEDMGALIDKLTFEFAAGMDRAEGIVWMRRIAK